MLNQHKVRRSLGRYGVVSLSEARTEAKRQMAEKTLGKTRPQSLTYPQAVTLFIDEKRKGRKPRTVEDYIRHLNLLGFTGQVSEIGTKDIDRKVKSLTPGEFNHRLVAARAFFNWAQKRRYLEHNPTLGLSLYPAKKRKRILTDAELVAVWKAADQVESDFGTIVKLLIVGGQRRGETAAIRKAYYSHNQQTLCFPGEITKNGREHLLPLGPLSQAILLPLTATAGEHLLFPARGTTDRPLNGWSKNKRALDKHAKVTGWTLHDLRRTYRSNLGRLAIAPHIAERMLNHISARSPLEETYDAWPYLEEMRAAQNTYEHFLADLLARAGCCALSDCHAPAPC